MLKNSTDIKTNDFLYSIIIDAPIGIIAIDSLGKIIIANNRAVSLLGLENRIKDLYEFSIFEKLFELEEAEIHIKKCLNEGRSFALTDVHFQDKYLGIKGRKLDEGMVLTITDITSLKESKYMAFNSLIEGQELERKRLAREIHDGIGPILSTLKMNLANIEGDVEDSNTSLREKFQKSYEMIDEAAADLRSISHNLTPKVLSDFGLSEALESLCEKIDATKSVNVAFINSGLEIRLNDVTELSLYRISQELINNSLKYAVVFIHQSDTFTMLNQL